MAGPATNLATFGAVYRTLGGRILAIYLGTVAVMSILFGLLFEGLLQGQGPGGHGVHGPHEGSGWLGVLSALVLIALLAFLSLNRLRRRLAAAETPAADLTLKVQGMTCGHCVSAVKRALEGFDSVEEASPDLGSGLVRVRGSHLDASALIGAVEKAGYQVVEDP
jgi:copper chaperone CopZ